MNKKAIIFDLDNTIYPVSSIGDQLFAPLLQLIHKSGELNDVIADVRSAIQRKPFQYVAEQYGMSAELKNNGLALLKELAYEGHMCTYPGYEHVRNLPQVKHLVTAGFTKLQWSKIEQLGISDDFKSIHIIDRMNSDDTKKDVFNKIRELNGYDITALLVVGDDPESEIKDGMAIGMDVIWLDSLNLGYNIPYVPKVNTLMEVAAYIRSNFG